MVAVAAYLLLASGCSLLPRRGAGGPGTVPHQVDADGDGRRAAPGPGGTQPPDASLQQGLHLLRVGTAELIKADGSKPGVVDVG